MEHLLVALLIVLTTAGMGISRCLKPQELEKMTFYIEEPKQKEIYPIGTKRTTYAFEKKNGGYTAVHTTLQFVADASAEQGYSYIEQITESSVDEKLYKQWKKAVHKFGVKNWDGFIAKEDRAKKEAHFYMEMHYGEEKTIQAEGYGNWPTGYFEYVCFLKKFFTKLEKQNMQCVNGQ